MAHSVSPQSCLEGPQVHPRDGVEDLRHRQKSHARHRSGCADPFRQHLAGERDCVDSVPGIGYSVSKRLRTIAEQPIPGTKRPTGYSYLSTVPGFSRAARSV
jgi:hypothetical protein